jgi:hypothetical protein
LTPSYDQAKVQVEWGSLKGNNLGAGVRFIVKVGENFEIQFEVVTGGKGHWTNWASFAVIAVFIALMAAGGYAVITGDATLFDKLLESGVSVVKAAIAKG